MTIPIPAPVSQENLTGQVYTRRKEGVCRLRYLPGEARTEARVAEEYNVSKTTAKLALHQLAQEGWLTADFRRKMRVREIDPQTVEELYQFRELLERDHWQGAMKLALAALTTEAVQNQVDR